MLVVAYFFFNPFYHVELAWRYAVSPNKIGAQRPCLPPEMELARQEMNYFYNSWLDQHGLFEKEICATDLFQYKPRPT